MFINITETYLSNIFKIFPWSYLIMKQKDTWENDKLLKSKIKKKSLILQKIKLKNDNFF